MFYNSIAFKAKSNFKELRMKVRYPKKDSYKESFEKQKKALLDFNRSLANHKKYEILNEILKESKFKKRSAE